MCSALGRRMCSTEYGSSLFGYIWYNIIIAPNNGSSVVVRLLMLVVVVVCYRRMVSREIPSLNKNGKDRDENNEGRDGG